MRQSASTNLQSVRETNGRCEMLARHSAGDKADDGGGSGDGFLQKMKQGNGINDGRG